MSLALHDLSVDAKQAFLEGYGMSPAQVLEAAPVLRAFNVLNYAQAVDRATDEAKASPAPALAAAFKDVWSDGGISWRN